jgi:hypothetical protein
LRILHGGWGKEKNDKKYIYTLVIKIKLDEMSAFHVFKERVIVLLYIYIYIYINALNGDIINKNKILKYKVCFTILILKRYYLLEW